MFVNLLLCISFVISSVQCAPYPVPSKEGHEHRSLLTSSNSTNFHSRRHSHRRSHTVYSPNWAGAVTKSSGVTHVTGTFNVPSVRAPADSDPSGSYSGSVWVGIDGYSCTSAILQAGFDFNIQDGKVSYAPWYEWWPASSMYWTEGIDLSEGDKVIITIKATSSTSGSVVLENKTKGQTVSHNFEDQNEGQLCQTDAEWIVEDWEKAGSLVSLADFAAITFHHAHAVTEDGTLGVHKATLVDMTKARGSKDVVVHASTSAPGKVVISHA